MYPDVVVHQLVIGKGETAEGADAPSIHAFLLLTADGLLLVEFGEAKHYTFVLITKDLGIVGERFAI